MQALQGSPSGARRRQPPEAFALALQGSPTGITTERSEVVISLHPHELTPAPLLPANPAPSLK